MSSGYGIDTLFVIALGLRARHTTNYTLGAMRWPRDTGNQPSQIEISRTTDHSLARFVYALYSSADANSLRWHRCQQTMLRPAKGADPNIPTVVTVSPAAHQYSPRHLRPQSRGQGKLWVESHEFSQRASHRSYSYTRQTCGSELCRPSYCMLPGTGVRTDIHERSI